MNISRDSSWFLIERKHAALHDRHRTMSQDPAEFHDPEEFIPERFLEVDNHLPERDPRTFIFGFGRRCVPCLIYCTLRYLKHRVVPRRICPGRDFAGNSMFLAIATSLAVFNIGRAKDEAGMVSEPSLGYDPGVVTCVKEICLSVPLCLSRYSSVALVDTSRRAATRGPSHAPSSPAP